MGSEMCIRDRRAFVQAAEGGHDLPRLALAFAGAQASVATTIVGCASADEVTTCAQAFAQAPTSAQWEAINRIRETFRESR